MPEYSFLPQIPLPSGSVSLISEVSSLSVDAHAPDRLLEQGFANGRELGYAPIQPCETVGMNTTIVVGGSTEMAVPVGNGQQLVVLRLSLQSYGKVLYITARKIPQNAPA